MAKRKRLGPVLLGGEPEKSLTWGSETGLEGPPIARIAADTSAQAAFEDVARALSEARDEGRLAQRLPLDRIETGHLARDRIAFDTDEMQALEASIAARGQQVPIEVVDQGNGHFGLISGLRRVMALRSLGATEVLAVLRRPETAANAYLAMVEENEIRAGVSFYERARIACEAVRLRIHPDLGTAIQNLFPTASAAKRSKIGTFATLHRELGDALRFPTAIPERMGLALGAALAQGEGAAARLSTLLTDGDASDARTERALLESALAEFHANRRQRAGGDQPDKPATRGRPPVKPRMIRSDLTIEIRGGKAILAGEALTEDLILRLERWLAED